MFEQCGSLAATADGQTDTLIKTWLQFKRVVGNVGHILRWGMQVEVGLSGCLLRVCSVELE